MSYFYWLMGLCFAVMLAALIETAFLRNEDN